MSAHQLSAHPLPTHAPGASGCVLHSTGLHLARARAWLHAFAEHAPTVWQGARDAMAEARPVPPSGPGLAATTLHPSPDPAHPVDTRITQRSQPPFPSHFARTHAMNESARIFVADHQGMVGAAVLRQLLVQQHPAHHLITRDEHELPLHDQAAVLSFLASERIDRIYLPVPSPSAPAQQHPAFPLLALSQLIHAASVHRVPQLVLIGTPHVYPDKALSPLAEEDLLTGRLAPGSENVALAQIAAIQLCENLSRPGAGTHARTPALDYRCLIIPTPYGPGDCIDSPDGHTVAGVIHRLHHARLTHQPRITLPRPHDTWNEYLHVDDCARAAIHLMNVPYGAYRRQVQHGVAHLNAGGSHHGSLGVLAHAVAHVVGYTGVIDPPPTEPEWTAPRRLDSYRMRSLGWTPTLHMEDALALTYAHNLAHHSEWPSATPA
ncbi:MAG: NAD-dependent epimerase/dehydratase family protein [Hydrogenophaga sp.]|nr:NAD-dependent epimerase/dehydratase family protein [Hydrogenophaga sp.]